MCFLAERGQRESGRGNLSGAHPGPRDAARFDDRWDKLTLSPLGAVVREVEGGYGKADDDVVVIRAPSTVLNPTLDQRVIDDALTRDPAAARAEWLAEWRDDVSTFVSRELIEACVDRGVVSRAAAAEDVLPRVLRSVGRSGRRLHPRHRACR